MMAGKRRFVAAAERKICQRYKAGESSLELAEALNCHFHTIIRALERCGVPRRACTEWQLAKRHRNYGGSIETLVVKLYLAGHSTYEVAAELEISQGMVGRILREQNVPRRKAYQERKAA